ncbi:MAG: hydrogenase [Planctomycetes bacterium]|nr:hydrogenase [Planctomycetota bacterium]
MNTWLLIAAIGLAATSGVPALCAGPSKRWGRSLATAMQVVAATCGAAAAVLVLAGQSMPPLRVAISPLVPAMTFALDVLSAWFLLPVCVLCACASVFDLGWRAGGTRVPVFLGVLAASLMALLAAQDGIAFLVTWEAMALAAFFLVATDHHEREVRDAAWLYLATTHASTLLLVAWVGTMAWSTGSFAFTTLDPTVPAAARDGLFLLALGGFGIKAGIVPFHFWLPAAHASAPSHVSAVMSGVLIKMGIYGLARLLWLVPTPPQWWGVTLLALGCVSAFTGVAFAIAQHDLKRLLAYHSIENIGIILLGLGLAALGRATDRAELFALGLAGALLHTWNHGLFKGLLFLAAGATIHAARTRVIDRLGGLGRKMPQTAACFLIGAVAICGLPPLNGFVSELLTYLGLFSALSADGATAPLAAIAITVLAAVGAMALLCFVKVFGVVYLGAPRGSVDPAADDGGPALRAPMFVLAGACAGLGIAPFCVVPALQTVIDDWPALSDAAGGLAALAPATWISVAALALLLGLAVMLRALRLRRDPAQAARPTWDCGYVRNAPSIQYTAASFAQQFVDASRRLLLPRTHRPDLDALFPGPRRFESHVPDVVLDRLLLPALRGVAAGCNALRLLQRGRVQIYVLYVFLTLLVLLLLR